MDTGIVKMVEISKKHKDELLRRVKEPIFYPEDKIGRTAIGSVCELIVKNEGLSVKQIDSLSIPTEPVPKKTPYEITMQTKLALAEIKLSRSGKNSRLVNEHKVSAHKSLRFLFHAPE